MQDIQLARLENTRSVELREVFRARVSAVSTDLGLLMLVSLGAQVLGALTHATHLLRATTPLLAVAYFALFVATRGATPGQARSRLRVVCVDGSRVSVPRALVRSVLLVGPLVAAGYAAGLTAPTKASPGLALYSLAPLAASSLLALVLLALGSLDSQGRMLHDRLAGTRVVSSPSAQRSSKRVATNNQPI